MFIVFEGLDGSGSTTQSRLLAEKLGKKGIPAFLTKEPTDNTPIGKMIREVLQHKWTVSPEGLQLLFTADRAEHIKNSIKPALKNQQVVISDRYIMSSIAYGGIDLDIAWLESLNKGFIEPDITFLFKLEPEKCIKRIIGRGSEFELFEKTEKLEKIWSNYEKIRGKFKRVHVIDAEKSIEEISEEIWEIIEKNI